jgi:hypothetical protein
MAIAQEVVVLDSRDQPAASCVVCGNDIPVGEGDTARYKGRTLRFRCPGCRVRFEADPEPVSGGAAAALLRRDTRPFARERVALRLIVGMPGASEFPSRTVR